MKHLELLLAATQSNEMLLARLTSTFPRGADFEVSPGKAEIA